MRLILASALAALTAGGAAAYDAPKVALKDPFGSVLWEFHQVELLGNPDRIAFDDRVKVSAPPNAEDPFHVPVMVDATEIPDVDMIVMSADFGPIPKILVYRPGAALAKLAFRFKIDQSTPVRAAVRTTDGAWHVGGAEIDAAGGGCTAPAAAYASDDWEERLGEVHGRIWPESGRVRMIVDHPMDTGLADGIPAFYIEELTVSAPSGAAPAHLELHEPVEENPAFTLFFAPGALGREATLTGRDNNGNLVRATLRAALTE